MRSLVTAILTILASCTPELEQLDPALVARGLFENEAGAKLELRDDGSFTWWRDAYGYRVDGFVSRVGRRIELVCPGGDSRELPTRYVCATAHGLQFLVPDWEFAAFVFHVRDQDGGERRWFQRPLPPEIASPSDPPHLPAPFDELLTARTSTVNVADWQGELRAGDISYRVTLEITNDRFAWSGTGCWIGDEELSGSVEPVGSFLVLRPDDRANARSVPIVLVPARSGTRRCLLTVGAIVEHAVDRDTRGQAGLSLAFTDDGRPCDEPLELPRPFAAWRLTEPLNARVIAIEAQRTAHTAAVVRVDVGARDGAFPGLRLPRLPRGADELELYEVFERSSLGCTRGESERRPWPVGTECSTRRPEVVQPLRNAATR